jgi:Na+-transporting methylmalonyl-CoA/oxaloacetate decarboxylase gamma subunit
MLRALNAQGLHGKVVDTTERAVEAQTEENKSARFEGVGVVFQYLTALLRHRGQLGKFVTTFFEEMPAGNKEATPEVLGDLLRSIALYFVALNRPRAARGAISWAIRLHETVPSPAKHFHDSLVKELVYWAQGRPGVAKDKVQVVVNEIEAELRPFTGELCSIERLSKWWLLLLKSFVGDTEKLSALAEWVAGNDASPERRQAAETLDASTSNLRMLKRVAKREIEKELRGR